MTTEDEIDFDIFCKSISRLEDDEILNSNLQLIISPTAKDYSKKNPETVKSLFCCKNMISIDSALSV